MGWAPHLGIKALLSLLVNHQTIAAIGVGPVSPGKEEARGCYAAERDPVLKRGQEAICAVICTKG